MNDMKKKYRGQGLSFYFAIGKKAKFQFELQGGVFRLVILWFAVAIIPYDIEYLLFTTMSRLDKQEQPEKAKIDVNV